MAKDNELVWKRRIVASQETWVPYTREFAPENPTRPYPTIWNDTQTMRQAKAHLKTLFAGETLFYTPKPEPLLRRVIEISTEPGDIVLDPFAGSGTAGAVAHKLRRQWIMIEAESYIRIHITKRLEKVIEGLDQGGISQDIAWEGGGSFKYLTLGAFVFDELGNMCSEMSYEELAPYVFYSQTGEPMPNRVNGTPFLGATKSGVGVYLLYNGVSKDNYSRGSTILTREVLASLPTHDGPKVVYGAGCLLSEAKLREWGITFKQIPYDLRVA